MEHRARCGSSPSPQRSLAGLGRFPVKHFTLRNASIAEEFWTLHSVTSVEFMKIPSEVFFFFSNCCMKMYGKAGMTKIYGNFRNPVTKTVPCDVRKSRRPAVGLRVNRSLKEQNGRDTVQHSMRSGTK